MIGVLGWVSLVFCLLSADRTAWLIRYAVIALAIQLANLPFAWIQRYNPETAAQRPQKAFITDRNLI